LHGRHYNLASSYVKLIVGTYSKTYHNKIATRLTKPKLALLFIRVYRGLFAILGGNQAAMREWLRQNNLALQGQPLAKIQTIMGLSSTVNYVDAMRGKI